MEAFLNSASHWGHMAVGGIYVVLAIWVWHKYGSRNRQQILLLASLAITSVWGFVAALSGPESLSSLTAESARNLAWLGFMWFLLRSGEGKNQPLTINLIYFVLLMLLFGQLSFDTLANIYAGEAAAMAMLDNAVLTLRTLFAIGALVLVHNLYIVSAPEARWGIALPMAALAAMWTFDLNLYTIAYLTGETATELVSTRGIAMGLLAPIFVMASQRNSAWRLSLSRSVAFQSVSLLVIGGYMVAMILLAAALELIGGTYMRLAQVSLIFGMSIAALLIMPSGRFKAWLNVIIAKNFFQHRYDYRSEWMRFADTIGFPSQHAAPFNERVVKSLADIFGCSSGLLLAPDEQNALTLQARYNWATVDVPPNCVTTQTRPFFESTGHILAMDDVRAGTDERCDPRAVPQWLYDEPQAWAVVPLVHFGKLAGLAVLGRPPLNRKLDLEDFDMLRVVGRQLASYLAEASSQHALAEAQQFEQFNRRFAFVMHDIKNLVSQLSILARNAEKHAGKPDFREDMIDTLQSSVGKMNDLLARLSQHNKAKHAAPTTIDIGATIMKAVHAKRLVYPVEANVTEGVMAKADPARVETIINHLVQNGIEATDDGSPIKITSRQQDDEVAIIVSDNGCGMSETFIANGLFKPFDSTKHGGFGVGAYEARTLAQSMGGQLRVDSRLGKGSRFTLILPLASEDRDAADHEEAA